MKINNNKNNIFFSVLSFSLTMTIFEISPFLSKIFSSHSYFINAELSPPKKPNKIINKTRRIWYTNYELKPQGSCHPVYEPEQ